MKSQGVDDISHIHKFIYISNYKKAVNIAALKSHDIGAVLYVGKTPKLDQTLHLYTINNIIHKFIKLEDTIDADISSCCDEACNFINYAAKNKINILIHCRQGISRSPTVVACYLLRLLYATKKDRAHPVLNDILDLIHLYRPCSKPNTNFVLQLKKHEQDITDRHRLDKLIKLAQS
jgi:predicted protein tyrosine phosphatase